MSDEAISILKEINNKLGIIESNTELVLYDIPKIMEITELGYNTILDFFQNKQKYPTFPRIQSTVENTKLKQESLIIGIQIFQRRNKKC